jgi:hypothetical protein
MVNKLTKNKFVLKIISKVMITLLVIVASSLTVYIFSKQIKKINLTMNEKKEMDYLISNREAVNNNIKADFMSVDPSYQDKISGAIPPVYNILPFVDSLESLSKKYSFTQTVGFSQPVPAVDVNGPLKLMVITFNINISEINADNFILFLKDFENLPYFASINNISYLSAGKSGWQENSSINLTGSLYAHE